MKDDPDRRWLQSIRDGERWVPVDGKGRLVRKGGPAICATALYFNDEDIRIDWNDEKKEFQVRLASNDRGKHERLITSLTLEVASHSSCSCGSELLLANYSVRHEQGELIFEGTYRCSVCQKSQRSFFGGLRKLIAEVWTKTSKVEVGVTGVKYQKDSQE